MLEQLKTGPPRIELKYHIPRHQVALIRSYLQHQLQPVKFNSYKSKVFSIYFDSYDLSRISESLAGISKRRKLRLRWYDSKKPSRFMTLELKNRLGKFNQKERCKIDITAKNINSNKGELNDFSWNSIEDHLPHSFLTAMVQGDIPIVLIKYTREHFQSNVTPLRITLDTDISAATVTFPRLFSHTSPFQLLPDSLIEIKTVEDYLDYSQFLIKPFNLRQSRFSKYLQGAACFGYALGKNATLIQQGK